MVGVTPGTATRGKAYHPASVREAEAALGIDRKAIEAKVKAELKAKGKKGKAVQSVPTEPS